jgi:hypothetical protein
MAKEATGWQEQLGWGGGPLAEPFPAQAPIRSALNAWVRRRLKKEWQEEWGRSQHGHHLRQLLPKITPRTVDLYGGLAPAERSVLAVGTNAHREDRVK